MFRQVRTLCDTLGCAIIGRSRPMFSSPLFIRTLRRSLTKHIQLRLWYSRLLLVVLTTATACCTRSTSMSRKLCNQFYTRPLVSSRGNGSFDSNISTPSLRDDLHWLPIVYKLCVIIYRCLHQTALKYLQELTLTHNSRAD